MYVIIFYSYILEYWSIRTVRARVIIAVNRYTLARVYAINVILVLGIIHD